MLTQEMRLLIAGNKMIRRNKVKQVLNDPATTAPPVAPEPQPRENLFPLLQAGDPGSAGSIVPLFTARNPIIGG